MKKAISPYTKVPYTHTIGARTDEVINQLAPFLRWQLPAALLAHTLPGWPTHAAGIREAIGLHEKNTRQPPKLSALSRWWRD